MSALSAPTVSAIKQTISHLYRKPTSNSLSFAHAPSFLSAPSAPAPSSSVRSYLANLTATANEVANINACGSVLAGQGSESDEYGDVAVWLGSGKDDGGFAQGKEGEVLKALGLDAWFGLDTQTKDLQSPLHLPTTFQSPSPSPELDKLTELLGQLNDRHYFLVEGGPDKDICVAHFLVGQLSQADAKGWVGLVGMGVWS